MAIEGQLLFRYAYGRPKCKKLASFFGFLQKRMLLTHACPVYCFFFRGPEFCCVLVLKRTFCSGSFHLARLGLGFFSFG